MTEINGISSGAPRGAEASAAGQSPSDRRDRIGGSPPRVGGGRDGGENDDSNERAGPLRTPSAEAVGVLAGADRGGIPPRVNRKRRRATKARIKLASLNMRGLGQTDATGANEKWMRINQIMKEQKIVVLAIQEAHLTEEKASQLNDLFSSSIIVYTSPDERAPTAAKGVAFVLNKKLVAEGTQVEVITNIPGRAMTMTMPWGAQNKLRIANVYAPNSASENAVFWADLEIGEGVKRLKDIDVLMGDFNVVEQPLDRIPARPDPENATQALAGLLRKMRLVDGWRDEQPDTRAFSFLQEGTGSQSRIDRIYVTGALLGKSADWDITGSGVRTDHQMVVCSLANYNAPFVGKGRWVIPASVIQDKVFLESTIAKGIKLQNEISSMQCRNAQMNPQVLYQVLKNDIRIEARARTKQLFSKWDRKINEMKQQIKDTLNGGQNEMREPDAAH